MSAHERLIERQLKSLGLTRTELPSDIEDWQKFLEKIVKAYAESEQERYLLERSLQISSREMQDRWIEIHSSETRKNSILSASIDAIICFNPLGDLIEFNQAAEQAFGLSHNPKDSLNIGSFIDLKICEEIFGQRIEYEARKWTGEIFPVETVLTPVKFKDDISYCLFIRDISEQKKSEVMINEQQMKLISVERLAALGRMAGNIAHEINNPLAIINLSLLALKKNMAKLDFVSPPVTENILNIEQTLSRISKIITGLRTLTRDSKTFSKEHISVRIMINDVLGLSSEKFRNSGIEIRCKIDEIGYESLLHCDRVQFSQVLINLLSNAFDAVQETKEKWVEITYEKNGNRHELRITDSGSGVPHDISLRMFEPFFTSKDVGKGTGLGLSISRSIVEKHGGMIELETTSKNTTFLISIPE